MTPGEPLHVVDLVLFKYGLEGFFICLGMNPKSKAPCKVLMELDSMARRIGRYLSHPVSYTHLTLPTICSV